MTSPVTNGEVMTKSLKQVWGQLAVAAVAALTFACLLSFPVMAAVAVPAPEVSRSLSSIFLSSGIVEQVVQIALLVLSAFVLPKLYQWLNLRADDSRRYAVEAALQAALKYGAAKVSTDYSKLVNQPALLQQLLDTAEAYAKASVPESMAKLGIPDEAVREKLEARILDFITELAKNSEIVSDAPGSGYLQNVSLDDSQQKLV